MIGRARVCLALLGAVLLVASCATQSGRSVEAVAPTLSSAAQATPTLPPSVDLSPTEMTAEPPGQTVSQTPTSTPSPTLPPTATSTPTPFVCPFLHGRTEIDSLQSSAMGEQVRFLVHLPPCYDQYPDSAFPVIYLFHGWPLDEWHWDDLGMDEWSDDWVGRGLTAPFLLVMPGVDQDGLYVNSSGGNSSFEGFVVDELVPHIDSVYRTMRTPLGRAVGGISRGGVWALEIAMRHQATFSIVGGHSPALALNRPLPQYDPFLLAREGVSDLRLYLDAGDGDWARAGTIRLRDLLQELDADVTYQVHSGGHVDELWRGAIPDYLAFYTRTWPPSYETLPLWTGNDQAVGPSEAP